jgi:hypothetical protein
MKRLIIPTIVAETQRNLQAFAINCIKSDQLVRVPSSGRIVRRSIGSVPRGTQLELDV